jgi:ABC-type uncharacterized transport system substrate-binding protein
MKRREFIGLLSGATAWPLAARAQQSGRAPRIGYLSPTAGFNPVDEAFQKSLEQLGWVKGRNIEIEYRYTGGQQDKVAQVLREVADLSLDLFVAWSPPLALGIKQMLPQTPLIFLQDTDGVAWGLVPNVARPGGNVTGVTAFASEQFGGKRLELLKEAVPSLTRVALLFSTERNRTKTVSDATKAAAEALRLELDEIEVHVPRELEAAMRGAKDRGVQAVYVASTGFAYAFAKEICDASKVNGLPSIHPFPEARVSDCLLAFGADLRVQAQRAAAYVDKILKGTQAGSLPVEQMSKHELVISLRTARTLGLTIPPSLLARADEIIE